ncbi:bifunctional serine/threonine-protein kinase/formylglycine-generating enzyme family protein [Crocosphaera sp. XPORK-15E]|uniref:bifunctional serine/threonine-protein kinase/formylglycine-generating enzyme family protein n=1 Tax=Crocosphaera sp. XPORK-15E TaxID=3110247 RepID=UPI002B1EC246|nr:bifunctional serine/threonine-protein kinase/formylglycine-generating enzyme family protein [Crocosphaera sp. XPORK-15E]MEA5534284.1 bifunctional serine/threonine-protein kinase/formylglycine-generating enzyme family protein [Crocosphaera sp. XPORK-15E]
MTICCLNPTCTKPENLDGTQFCIACGTSITVLRNHYRPLKLLSDEGGFGRTYLAEDIDRLNAKCVIKQLCPQKQGTAAFGKVQDLFEDEAKQLQQLGEHPQIPQLLAYFKEEDYLYLVQQYIEGKTLDKLYNRCWTETEVRDFLNNILPVFEFIHQKKVIHRDIKPTNIMGRDDNKQYVLIDFGASKDFAATVATRGTKIGTEGYAAFEQMKSGEAFNASDLFSLGATCFFLLTQIDPYNLLLEEGYQWVNQWQTHLKQPISDDLRQVLDKLLQKDRRNRYQSATEVLTALQPKAQQKQITTPPPQQPTPVTKAQQKQSPPPQPQPIHPTLVQTPSQPQPQNRRKFLQFLGYGSIGVIAVGLFAWWKNNNSSTSIPTPTPTPTSTPTPTPTPTTTDTFPLETFSFETVKVDPQGNIVQRETKQGEQFTIALENDVSLDMVKIPGGTFIMGSPETEAGRQDDEAQQEVTVDDFYIGKYEVTQPQWEAIMGNNPSKFNKGGKYPVEQVSWNDCQEFCQKLSEKTGLTFTLPTEAQWEYACRAGTTTPFYYGETLNTDIANYDGNYVYGEGKKGIDRGETTEVGSFPANGFGLYDMHGNLWEWCQDDYNQNYQANNKNSQQAVSKVTANAVMLVSASSNIGILVENDYQYKKVVRGGSYLNDPRYCRSANRLINGARNDLNGLRVVCGLPRTL